MPRGQVNIKTAFNELVQDSKQYFGAVVRNTNAWVNEVTRMRHGAAHGGLQGDDKRLYALSESVYLLIVLSLLLDAGMPAPVLRHVAEHRRWHNVSAYIS